MNKKCIGCGSILQSNSENELGFVPFEKLLLEDNILCKRCFQLKNYGINKQEILSEEFYKQEVEKSINKTNLVLLVIDIFDFESSFTNEILDILREKDSIILVNKVDLLPRNVVENKLIDWIKQRFLDEGIFPYNISFVSAKSKVGINGILKKVISFAKERNQNNISCSIIGVSNTGKSSIINSVLDSFDINVNNRSLVSKYSGTTIKNIKMSFSYKGLNISIYDTPGLLPKGRILEYLDIESSLKLIPQNRIIPKKYNLKFGDILVLTKYITIENKTKKLDKNEVEHSISFNVYVSPFIKIHKTKPDKYLELKETTFYNMNQNETLLVNEYVGIEKKVEKYDEIAISGIGFISVSENCILRITVPKDIKVVIRKPMLRIKNGC